MSCIDMVTLGSDFWWRGDQSLIKCTSKVNLISLKISLNGKTSSSLDPPDTESQFRSRHLQDFSIFARDLIWFVGHPCGRKEGFASIVGDNEQRDQKSIIPWRSRSLNSDVNDNGINRIIGEDYHNFVLNNQQRDVDPDWPHLLVCPGRFWCV